MHTLDKIPIDSIASKVQVHAISKFVGYGKLLWLIEWHKLNLFAMWFQADPNTNHLIPFTHDESCLYGFESWYKLNDCVDEEELVVSWALFAHLLGTSSVQQHLVVIYFSVSALQYRSTLLSYTMDRVIQWTV